MKYKKIRGKNRRIRHIQKWVERNSVLDMAKLQNYQAEYVEFWVSPWARLSFTNSQYPQPLGIYKTLFIQGLVDIYLAWKKQLDELEQPYYLKIWLFENDLKRSQVVCAINDKIDCYHNTFREASENISIDHCIHYKDVNEILDQLQWFNRIDMTYYEEDFIGQLEDYSSLKYYQESKRWFEEYVLKKHKFVSNTGGQNFYVVESGQVWIGGLA